MDYNQVYLTRSDTLLIWNSVNYNTLAAFQAATGQMLNGINADPKWANIGARDFHLTAGSPAIDSASSGITGQPGSDVAGVARVDDPATTNSGRRPAHVRRSRRLRVSAVGRFATVGCVGGEPVLGCVPVAGVGRCFWFFGQRRNADCELQVRLRRRLCGCRPAVRRDRNTHLFGGRNVRRDRHGHRHRRQVLDDDTKR